MLFPKSSLRFARAYFSVAALITALLGASVPAVAEDKETIISAQQMHTDQNTGVVTALGKVEIAHAGYILHADKVSYAQKTGVMHAEGNVALLTPTGEVQFSDSEDVTGDMKQAFIENIGILFSDNSRLSAKTAQRYEGRYTVADTAAYTACNVCKEDPKIPPLWQLRARQIVHDNEKHDIYYHDATLDMAGVPVLYTPYLSSPDPTVTRRQGFLSPAPGYTPTLGMLVRTPYYFDIAPDIDATMAPTFSQTDGAQFAGEYRQRFAHGLLQMDGSFTHANLVNDQNVDQGKNWRGHFFGKLLYNINNIWRAGSDVNFASDKSYLPRYHLGGTDQLTTRNYIEGFSGRNYAGINNYYFQDLRPGTQAVQPIVLPQASFSAFGEPGQTFGGRWSLDGNMLVTKRDNENQSLWQQGPDTRRLAMNGGWQRRMVSDTGLIATLSGLLHLDAYSADNVIDPSGNGQVYNNVLFARQFEQGNAVLSYPLSRNGNGYQQLLQPMVGVTVAPIVHNSAEQPIEESQDITFDETNLFSPNRFTGYDLIEGGSRATYGLRHMMTIDGGGSVDMFGGQSYNFTPDRAFTVNSGLHDHLSDYVGNISVKPTDWFLVNYGFRLNHNTLDPQRQYALASIGNRIFRPYARYSSGYSLGTNGIIEKIDDATAGFDWHFAKYWSLHAEHTHGFDPGPGPRSTNVTLGYGDECFVAAISAAQNDTQRVGVSSGTSVFFHIFLKNLGGFHTDGTTAVNFPTQFRQTD